MTVAHATSTLAPVAGGPAGRPAQSPLLSHWTLDPEIVYLNHGSYGACPVVVQEAQQRYRAQMEREAVSFYCRDVWGLLDRSRVALAGMLGGEARDYVFLPNATTAVATIAENVARGVGLDRPLAPGDEVLTTTHDYPACRFNLRRIVERAGARLVEVEFPTAETHRAPITADDIVEAVLAGVTDRTRVAMLCHVMSPTGLVLPIERLALAMRERGITLIVDGAHGPGAVVYDIPSLGVPFYTANCHKWLSAPKGAAMLWVRRDLQRDFRPMVLSNWAEAPEGAKGRSRFNLEFDYIGTDDVTPMCAVADAVEALPRIAGCDWAGLAARNRALALRGRDLLCDRLGVEKPFADDLIGPMASLTLPVVPESHRARLGARPTVFADALQDALLARHGIQVPIWRCGDQLGVGAFSGKRHIRISAQVYNTEAQYRYLADALVEELERELG